ncbi:hypothetical protein [Thermococcus sp.]
MLLLVPLVSAAYSGVEITTNVVPGNGDFFVELSAYGAYNPGDTLGSITVDEFPEQSFMFYISEGNSCIVWQGDYSSEFHAAFYSNGSWYLLLQGGYPLLRIDGKPFPRVYPYNLTYTSITIYRIKNGCIEPSWIIPTSSQEIFGSARLENNTIVLSSYPKTSWKGFEVNVPLKSFERYVSIINASAFAESLVAVQLSNGNVVIFFPKLYYFRLNGTVYGGVFESNFIPVFKGNKMYVFVYNSSLRAVPVARANLNLGRVFPGITAQCGLHACGSLNSGEMRIPKTSACGTLLGLGIVIALMVGAFVGYGMGKKKREVKE